MERSAQIDWAWAAWGGKSAEREKTEAATVERGDLKQDGQQVAELVGRRTALFGAQRCQQTVRRNRSLQPQGRESAPS
jgi:hypothetical protein